MNNIRVLIADDDSEIRKIASRSLKSQGFETFEYGNGTEAYEAICKQPFDLILLDIDMPGMNGIETFEKMKQFPFETPVIFLTASGLKEDVVSAIKLGAVNYLKKPFKPQELIRRVEQELAKS